MQLLERIAEILEWPDARLYAVVEDVSRWSPAQQVQHVLLGLVAFAKTLERLERGGHEKIAPRGAPRLVGRAVLLTGWIPRGRAQAPESLVPDAIPGRAGLLEMLGDARGRWEALVPRAKELRQVPGALPHPMLGAFTAAQWVRFARVHTDHHLAIVADIDRHRVVTEPLADPLAPMGGAP